MDDVFPSNIAYFLEKVVACTPGSLYWKDREGRYLGCNDFMLKTAGMSSTKEIIGKTDYDLWGEAAKQVMNNDQRVIQTGQTLNFDESLRIPSGETLYFTGVKMPLRDESNNIVGVIGNSLDITELKLTQEKLRIAKEQAESSNRAKSTFLANMSHDLKTPLSGILSTAENLAYKLKDPKDIHNVEYIMQSSERLMELLNEVIEIAKLEHHDIIEDQQLFNPLDIATRVVDLMKPTFEAKKVKLIVDFDESVPNYLIGNKILFHRVILNLVSNAIKFTDSGQVVIEIKMMSQKQDRADLKIVVEDTGIGIPREKQREIFELFTRIVPSYKGVHKGTGLGLYIVKQYVTQLGGEVRVDSQPGIGSTFTCVIPFSIALDQERFMRAYQEEQPVRDNLSEYSTPVAESQQAAHRKTPIHILVVEDQPGVQQAIKEKLGSLGYSVDIASTGQQAISLFASGKYDLIYLDIGLPDMDGYHVAKSIREIEKFIEDRTPIFALTAHADVQVKNGHIDDNLDGFLTKPLMRKQAQQIVEDFVIRGKKHSMVDIKKSDLKNANEVKVIDLELGAKLMDNNLEVAKELLSLLISHIPEHQVAMESVYDERDFESLEKAVHKLHSALCYSATPRLKAAIANFEMHLHLNHNDEIDSSYQAVQREIQALLSAFKEL